MKEFIIGIDIDGVLTDESHDNQNIWHDTLCRYLGRDIERIKDCYSFYDAYQLPVEIIDGFLQEHLEEIYSTTIPCPGARETLEWLDKEGFTIILITARNKEHRKITESWLKRYQIPYDLLIHDKNKAPLAVKNRIQLFVEDNGHNALKIAERNIPVILITKYHNQDIETGKMISRVSTWKEITKSISAYFQLKRPDTSSWFEIKEKGDATA